MPRTIGANYSAAAQRKGAKPYRILEVNWTSGTKYYADRDTWDAAGTRAPTLETAKVFDWGNVSIELKEQEIGGTDAFEIKLSDDSRAITTIQKAANQQTDTINVWGMFDDATCVWPTDRVLLFHGTLKPYTWDSSNNLATLSIENSSQALLQTISHAASRGIFPRIQDPYRDRHLPIAMGNAYRVPMILVDQPYILRTTEPIPSGGGDYTVHIDRHPSELGLPTGVATDVFVDGDPMSVTFTESGSPATVQSTMTVHSATQSNTLVGWAMPYMFGTGASRYGVFNQNEIYVPRGFKDIENFGLVGMSGEIWMWNRQLWVPCTIASLVLGTGTWPSSYKVQFTDATINADLYPGDYVKIFSSDTTRRAYQAGVDVRSKTQTYVYIANDLPSVAVDLVEGYGIVRDAAGFGTKDFIPLGGVIQDTIVGSTVVTGSTANPYVVNLNDSTWAATLGHNCTSVTFTQQPRSLKPDLDSDDLWATVRGVDDSRDSSGALISNPALAILEYLENPALLNINAALIDVASFAAAAADSSISGYRVGFAQIEPQSGLVMLQEMARQCHCVLFFDQATIKIVVLHNSAIAAIQNFDTDAVSGQDNVLMGSLTETHSPLEDMITHIQGKWRKYWDDITGNKLIQILSANENAATALKRRDQDMEIWLYYRRTDAEAELTFWKDRLSRIYRILTLKGFIDSVVVLPGDWVTLSWTDYTDSFVRYTAQPLEVLKSMVNSADGTVDIQARFAEFTF